MEFQWNENKVKELLSFIYNDNFISLLATGKACLENPHISPRDHIIDSFKKSKEKKEYEILSFSLTNGNKTIILPRTKDGKFTNGFDHFNETELINNDDYKIHSVKRLNNTK